MQKIHFCAMKISYLWLNLNETDNIFFARNALKTLDFLKTLHAKNIFLRNENQLFIVKFK